MTSPNSIAAVSGCQSVMPPVGATKSPVERKSTSWTATTVSPASVPDGVVPDVTPSVA